LHPDPISGRTARVVIFGGMARDARIVWIDTVVFQGKLQGDLWNQRFVAVADDGIDFFKGGKLIGGSLGVAAGDDEAGIGVLAADAAEVGTGLAVGFGGDATGIYNDNMG
jgi:hypothetical protein